MDSFKHDEAIRGLSNALDAVQHARDFKTVGAHDAMVKALNDHGDAVDSWRMALNRTGTNLSTAETSAKPSKRFTELTAVDSNTQL